MVDDCVFVYYDDCVEGGVEVGEFWVVFGGVDEVVCCCCCCCL